MVNGHAVGQHFSDFLGPPRPVLVNRVREALLFLHLECDDRGSLAAAAASSGNAV